MGRVRAEPVRAGRAEPSRAGPCGLCGARAEWVPGREGAQRGPRAERACKACGPEESVVRGSRAGSCRDIHSTMAFTAASAGESKSQIHVPGGPGPAAERGGPAGRTWASGDRQVGERAHADTDAGAVSDPARNQNEVRPGSDRRGWFGWRQTRGSTVSGSPAGWGRPGSRRRSWPSATREKRLRRGRPGCRVPGRLVP